MLGRDLGDELERLHDSFAVDGRRLGIGIAFEAEDALQLFHRRHAGDVALVVLDDDRRVVHVDLVLIHVIHQIGEALLVRVDHRRLGVGDEHDRVGALEHQLARLVVEDLAGDGIELDLEIEAPHFADVHGKEVEEERAVGLRGEGEHLPLRFGVELVEDDHQVRRLPTEAGTVIDDLRGHFARGVIEEIHKRLTALGSPLPGR